jgi:hypothetical protein
MDLLEMIILVVVIVEGGENPLGLKNKVSCTMTIITGLAVPKKLPNWYDFEGQRG